MAAKTTRHDGQLGLPGLEGPAATEIAPEGEAGPGPMVTASDGHIARTLTPWAREKLSLIERYDHIFCTGMKRKWACLVYADLLAGPGLCADPTTGWEALASPLLAVRRPEFARLFLNDADPGATAALTARTMNEPAGRIIVSTDDCNAIVDRVRAALFPPSLAAGTLGLAVIDPTGFQMRFDSIARLTAGGLRLDLLIIVMTGQIKRFAGQPGFEATMDGFFGTPAWRELVRGRQFGAPLTLRAILDLYEAQLKGLGYAYVDDHARVLNTRNVPLYHIILASRHPRGAEFFRKIGHRTAAGQRRLPLS